MYDINISRWVSALNIHAKGKKHLKYPSTNQSRLQLAPSTNIEKENDLSVSEPTPAGI